MASRTAALGLAALVTLTVPLALAPGAEAHCPGSANYRVLFVINNCDLQTGVEAAVNALNAGSDGTIAYVVAKDRRFHPDVVTIKNGGTVVFVNFPAFGVDEHDPRASGRCKNGANPLPNPELCLPTWQKVPDPFCFDVVVDQGGNLDINGGRYPVTLRYAAAPVKFEKSHGYLSGTPVGMATGAEAFQTCAPETGYVEAGRAVIPYHCGIHGIPGGANGVEVMRGAIVVVP